MERINIFRVLLAGLIASVAFIIIEFIFEGIASLAFGFNEAELAKQYFPDIILSGTRYQIINVIYLISTFTFTVWLYAALLPKFGSGPKTAIIAGLVLIALIVLFLVNQINMGIYPLKPALLSLIFGIIEFPLSIVAGATFYKVG